MATIRSFVLEVFDAAGRLIDRFNTPVEGAALFVNPLFRAIPEVDIARLHEPWYRLTPRRLTTGPLNAPTYYPAAPRPALHHPPLEIVVDPADPVRAINVTLFDLERPVYTADYSTVDVFGPLLVLLLQNRIAAGHYLATAGPFRLRVQPQIEGGDMHIFDLLPSDALTEDIFPLPVPRGDGARTTFQLVTRHTYDTRSLADMGRLRQHKPHLGGRNRLILQPAARQALAQTLQVSTAIEVGGYLVGQVYRQAEAPDTLLVDVRQVLAAESTRASAALLLFTGESWSALRRRLAGDLAGLRLLGWWHTHLFPASDDFGLSGLDETLHRQFFTSPWHFAALLNVSPEQGRVLRCFQPDQYGVLSECAFDVVET
jgi:hypothetical protein